MIVHIILSEGIFALLAYSILLLLADQRCDNYSWPRRRRFIYLYLFIYLFPRHQLSHRARPQWQNQKIHPQFPQSTGEKEDAKREKFFLS